MTTWHKRGHDNVTRGRGDVAGGPAGREQEASLKERGVGYAFENEHREDEGETDDARWFRVEGFGSRVSD